MKAQKQTTATIGLILITFLAAVQYFFLRNVPDTVSTFSFVCITNVIGLLILGTVRIRKLFSLRKKSLLKGALFALELTGFNFFLLLGARHLDAVVTSSVLSLYFVFITPMLLLLRKRVNFFSGIATVIAIIARSMKRNLSFLSILRFLQNVAPSAKRRYLNVRAESGELFP